MRVIHILSGDLWGGAEAQVLLQLAALRGVEVQVLLFNDGPSRQRFLERGIRCLVVDERQGFGVLLQQSLNEVGKRKPDVVVAHGYKEAAVGSYLSYKLQVPLVTWFHGWSENYSGWNGIKSKLYAAVFLLAAKLQARRVVTVTRALARQLQLESSKLRVIHNVAEPPSADITATELPGTGKKIVCIGRVAPVKRLDRAIEIVRRLNAAVPQFATLFIVGDGPERERLEERAKSNGEAVKFLGFRRDVASIIREADLVLLTSDSEGLPTVVLEALMAGTAVVASDLPGLRELNEALGQQAVALVPKEDIDGFVGAVQRATNPDEALVAKVRELYRPERAATQQVEMLRELVKE